MSDNRPEAKVVHFTDMPAEHFGDEAPGVSIRVLIDAEHDGAPVYVLRMIEVDQGCRTPDHNHPFEHENFVVDGTGEVVIEGGRHPVAQGDVVFIPAGVQHTYRNTGEGTFRFLCGIPVSKPR